MTLQPRVVDISHHNKVTDFHAAAAAGVWGVIHKASQGSSYADPDYARRRQLALDAGMLWAAYHFNDGSDVSRQVDWFLRCARPDRTTMLVLDFEDNPKSNMSVQQAVQFLRLVEQKTGRKAAIYSGNRLKESIGRLSAADRAYVVSHSLWLCQYSATPKITPGFADVFLWQYTDGHFGPPPHGMAGIEGDVDLNTFRGTRADLEAVWIGPDAGPLVIESSASSHSAAAAQDQIDDAAQDAADDAPEPTRSDDAPDLPPFLRSRGAAASPATGGINVQPVHAAYSVEIEVLQRELDALGYHEMGDIDGYWGGKTAAAIKAFLTDRGLASEIAQPGPTLNNEIAKAKLDRTTDGRPWSRPIAPARANATPKDVAPKVETVRVSLWGQFTAKIAAGFAALGLGGSTVSSAFQSVQDVLAPVHNFFARVPPEVWFLLIGAVACAVWYTTNRAARAATKDYNTGRLS